MNLPVRVPSNTEAAAMGGAIQALWCLFKNTPGEGKTTVKDLTEEHVVLEEGATITPDKKAVTAYNKAYAEYSRYLGALSPLYK
jgi:xylulokinase